MPRGDGTGPQGLGPMTGRSAGYCAGFDQPGFANSIPGCGLGRGGSGRGLRRGAGGGLGLGRGLRQGRGGRFSGIGEPAETRTAETRKQVLEQQLTALNSQVKTIEKTLAAMDSESEKTA